MQEICPDENVFSVFQKIYDILCIQPSAVITTERLLGCVSTSFTKLEN